MAFKTYRLGGQTRVKSAFGTFNVGPKPPKPKAAKPRPNLGAPGGAPAPAAKPAPKVVGQHAAPDSAYYNEIDLANREGAARLGQLDTQKRRINYDFGFTDPTNPFSRAAMLKKAFLEKYKGVSTALAAQGQLYSGAHERALARTRKQYDADYAEARQAWMDAIDANDRARGTSTFQTEQEKNDAFERWLARAPEAEDITPAPEDATAAKAPAAKAAPAAKPVAARGTPPHVATPVTPVASTAPIRTPTGAIAPAPVSMPTRSGGTGPKKVGAVGLGIAMPKPKAQPSKQKARARAAQRAAQKHAKAQVRKVRKGR